jgi:putative hydrolase of the HAD superfamily
MPQLGDIHAVSFDVGGTLILPWPSVGRIYGEVATAHGHPDLEPDVLDRQFGAAWRAKKNFDHSRQAWLKLVETTFAGLVDAPCVQDFFDDLYDRFASAQAWRVFDDVRPTLEALRGNGFKLAIISNWDDRLRPLLAELKLASCFDETVISVEAGFAKPAAEIFQRAASALGMPPRSIVHIGDSLAEDVVGARSAGLQVLLLDRKSTSGAVDCISTLSDLPSLLGSEVT